ncbi:TPA: hypothetical protein N0F65_001074 [Lagenidium giganteum]|uniref:Uncharacterized protein n=1 Tax=Lagenidium giganteum TaxID=4803 RepID=A0AAV2YLL6_9STRA|nr:TPA: hypothetical protein N0F65_001074 [Lagenidium giganteum]
MMAAVPTINLNITAAAMQPFDPLTQSNSGGGTPHVSAILSAQAFRVNKPSSSSASASKRVAEGRGVWSAEEHERFRQGIRMFPTGPWKDIAGMVGSRTARQTMTHAQKYRQKIARRLRTLRGSGRTGIPHSLMHSSRFNPLLTSDEHGNDSILSTSLAIIAEEELDSLHEYTLESAYGSPVSGFPDEPVNPATTPMLDLLRLPIDALVPLDATTELNDADFDECMDFLIQTFHSAPSSDC